MYMYMYVCERLQVDSWTMKTRSFFSNKKCKYLLQMFTKSFHGLTEQKMQAINFLTVNERLVY